MCSRWFLNQYWFYYNKIFIIKAIFRIFTHVDRCKSNAISIHLDAHTQTPYMCIKFFGKFFANYTRFVLKKRNFFFRSNRFLVDSFQLRTKSGKTDLKSVVKFNQKKNFFKETFRLSILWINNQIVTTINIGQTKLRNCFFTLNPNAMIFKIHSSENIAVKQRFMFKSKSFSLSLCL